MLIDAHLDLAFNAVAMGGDLRLPLDQLRASAYGQAGTATRETPTVSLPTLREADVRLVFGTIFVQAPRTSFKLPGPVYNSPEEANQQGWAQLRYYHQLAGSQEIKLIGGLGDLETVIQGQTPLPGLLPLMEGADPILDLAELEAWRAAGVQIVGPAWGATRYSGGTGAPGPLTPAGRELMGGLREHGMALDTSHLSEESFWEALRLFDGPTIASHANCRAFVPTDRQLSDDMIRAITERDGVIGIVPTSLFLVDGWKLDDGKTVGLDAVVRHIEHICTVAGDTKHVGIGSDFDGGFGVEWLPAGMESIADLPQIGTALLAAGWSQDDVDGVLSGNWLRWLRGLLK